MVVVFAYNYFLARLVYYSKSVYCFMNRIGSCRVTCTLHLVCLSACASDTQDVTYR